MALVIGFSLPEHFVIRVLDLGVNIGHGLAIGVTQDKFLVVAGFALLEFWQGGAASAASRHTVTGRFLGMRSTALRGDAATGQFDLGVLGNVGDLGGLQDNFFQGSQNQFLG